MIVGAAAIELHVHGSTSLKEKRGVVRSISQRVRNRFAVSVAEVGGQGTWTRAILGVATVGSDAVVVRRVLDQVVDFVEELHLAELVAQDVEVMRLPLAGEEDDVEADGERFDERDDVDADEERFDEEDEEDSGEEA